MSRFAKIGGPKLVNFANNLEVNRSRGQILTAYWQ